MINRDFWCSGRESNPYGHFCPRDFKSLLSTNSNTRAFFSDSKDTKNIRNPDTLCEFGFCILPEERCGQSCLHRMHEGL